MKMPKEYVLVLIVGLFLLAYLLEAVVDPLTVPLATPYQFLQNSYPAKFPFTSAVILIRSLAIFLTPIWLASFVQRAYQFKAVTLLILGTLLELYAVQAVATPTIGIPLEWAISFAFGGAILFLPMLFFFVKGSLSRPQPKAPAELGSLTDDDDDDDF